MRFLVDNCLDMNLIILRGKFMDETDRLHELNQKREKAEDEYYLIKKQNERINNQIMAKKNYIDKIMNEKAVYSDPEMMLFYEERRKNILDFQEKEAEFREIMEREWQKANEEWDEEELSIKKGVKEDEKSNDTKLGEKVEKQNN